MWWQWPLRSAVQAAYAETRSANATNRSTPSRSCAYVSLLFGEDVSLLISAIALGYSFIQVKSQFRHVLLHTPDVPHTWHVLLRAVGWQMQEVDYIKEDPILSEGMPRQGNMTKLHMLNRRAVRAHRVLYVDVTCLMLQCCDGLFEDFPLEEMPAAVPCSSMRGKCGEKVFCKAPFEHGERLPYGTTVNGAVVLLETNAAVFDLMVKDCGNPSEWHVATTFPDSHFQKWAHDKFSALHLAYNFSPLMGKGVGLYREWLRVKPEEVMVLHFFSWSRPTEWFVNGMPPQLPFVKEQDLYRKDDIDGLEFKSLQLRADTVAKLWVKVFCFSIIFAAHRLGLSIFSGNLNAQRRYLLLHFRGRTSAGPSACHVKVVQNLLKAAVVFLLQWRPPVR